jgi:hypothetical protein
MKEIATALVKAQKEMSNAVKGSSNPFFKSKYADLNSVREASIPVLNANGISVIQPMVNIDGRNFIKTVLLHESGESIESFTDIVYAKTNDAQAQGSGITYARRYGLQSLVCIGADDDDGNKASEQPKEAKKQPTNEEYNDNLQLALQEVEDCQLLIELEAVWKKWEAYQKDAKFKIAVTSKKTKCK